MLSLKVFILSFFGWLMCFGSTNPEVLKSAAYTPEESIVATEDGEQTPLFFDAILEVNQSSTYEIPGVKVDAPPYSQTFHVSVLLFDQLLYYKIGQKISVNLTTKTIIFPFHCFT